ncbi:hypothetical protein CBNV_gp042 [Clanis bilineata nucleopolyhedrovirus]|uniref:Uncharacterized protein n=1 Tax=Clanis bilineata nucleopolyhedrovirus TaxID=1307957 RepID=Q0N458_9ABAC|nr:hypothetical protein CBNV_gp042 [Clanis bilineata nucleopolyhedrovirus]ABF47385.1 hypothetical protein [Clanis bilineata nucleopolyhedrovirus]
MLVIKSKVQCRFHNFDHTSTQSHRVTHYHRFNLFTVSVSSFKFHKCRRQSLRCFQNLYRLSSRCFL